MGFRLRRRPAATVASKWKANAPACPAYPRSQRNPILPSSAPASGSPTSRGEAGPPPNRRPVPTPPVCWSRAPTRRLRASRTQRHPAGRDRRLAIARPPRIRSRQPNGIRWQSKTSKRPYFRSDAFALFPACPQRTCMAPRMERLHLIQNASRGASLHPGSQGAVPMQ